MKTVREAAQGFLEDMDERVVRLKFERIAVAVSRFVDYLDAEDVTDVGSIRIEHVEEFLFVGFPFDEMTRAEVDDVWYSVKQFLKWLRRRKLSEVYGEFAVRKAGLREGLRGFSAGRSPDDTGMS